MEGGSCDLLQYSKLKLLEKQKFSREEFTYIFWRLIEIIAELNEKGLYFQDLKPQNIILSEIKGVYKLRLIDIESIITED